VGAKLVDEAAASTPTGLVATIVDASHGALDERFVWAASTRKASQLVSNNGRKRESVSK
jgi:hypothetical protein